MTGKDMLIALGDISHIYYHEAECEQISAPAGTRVVRRPMLIAAIVALMLFLMGCALVVMHMKDLRIGERTVTNQAGETVQLDILSVQGIRNTPNYLANQEWLQFVESYTPEQGEYWQSTEDYWAYSVLDQTMVDKLDAICAKYGLRLIGKPWHEHTDCYEFLKLAGVKDLVKAGSAAKLHIPRGRFFAGGSFSAYGRLILPGGETLENLDFTYIKKDVFYDVFTFIDPNAATERSYTTEDGVSILLVEAEQAGMIMADRDDGFITVSVSLNEGVSLEEIAEQLDFSIRPTPIDAAAADAREQASIDAANGNGSEQVRTAYATYEEYIDTLRNAGLLTGEINTENPKNGYALYDLDGDGAKEVLLCHNGRISEILTMVDGEVEEGKSYNMVICQDNVLIDIMDLGDGGIYYHIFYFANDGDPVFSNPKERSIIRLMYQDGIWWRTSSTAHYAEFDTQITEEEAMEILNSYPRIDLEGKLISETEKP